MKLLCHAVFLPALLLAGCTIERVHHDLDDGGDAGEADAARDAAATDAGTPDDGGLDGGAPDAELDAATQDAGVDDAGSDAGCTSSTYYADIDEDGHGDPTSSVMACAPPVGYVDSYDDCDDTDAEIRPGATDVCDGVDNDCDDAVDEAATADPTCTLPHASAICGTGGVCVVDSCAGGWRNCNGIEHDGCEVDTDTSAADCGMCDNSCAAGVGCVSGICDDVIGVSASLYHSCVVRAAGLVLCWGGNSYGVLGDGTMAPHRTPLPVSGPTDYVAVYAAEQHTCGLREPGTVRCWGGDYGTTPVEVPGLSDVVTLDGERGEMCAVTSSGSVLCWHPGGAPSTIAGISGAIDAAHGGQHGCAVLGSGAVKCWGDNYFGQLGDGTTDPAITPVTVVGLTDAVQIDAGDHYTCALRASGTVACWGRGNGGQLGRGYPGDANSPVAVSGLTDIIEIAAGYMHACAVRSTGVVYCWGSNADGEVGDGTMTDPVLEPVAVLGLTGGAYGVTAGFRHSCALRSDSSVMCWGANDNGQIGDGTTTERRTATAVSGLP